MNEAAPRAQGLEEHASDNQLGKEKEALGDFEVAETRNKVSSPSIVEEKKDRAVEEHDLPRPKRRKMKGVQKLYYRPPNYEELRKHILGE